MNSYLKKIVEKIRRTKENKSLEEHYKNLKPLTYFTSPLEKRLPFERKNLIISNDSRVFEITNFLTIEECEFYIKESVSKQYNPVDWEYAKEYRDCERVILQSNKLAEDLWNRIKPLLVLEDLFEVKPFGFDNEGTWQPIGINECFRFTKYSKDGHFNPHRDGGFVRTDEERSVYTSFEGGATRFLSKTDKGFETIETVKPKAGKALIFNHDIWHEGEKITQGFKYIVRSDIMFRRLNGNLLKDKDKFKKDPNFIKAMKLYDESILLQKQGNPSLSTKKYLQALDLQAKFKSIPDLISASFFPKLPFDISRCIFSFLTDSEILNCARVSKDWKRFAFHPLVWKERYIKKWFILDENEDITTQWYTLYKNRTIAEKNFEVLCVDINHEKIRYFMPNNHAKFRGEIESKIAKKSGHYWSATSALYDQLKPLDYLIGPEVTDPEFQGYVYNPQPLIVKDEPHSDYLQMIDWIYDKGFTRPMESDQHPLLIAKPVWLSTIDFNFNKDWFVCVIDAPILSLLAWNGASTGVVVSVDNYVTTVACVVDREIIQKSVSFENSESSSIKAAEMTYSCIQKCSENSQFNLLKCILLRGDSTLNSDFDASFSSHLCSLGLKFILARGNERLRDVLNGANIFITQKDAKQKFIHLSTNAALPSSYTTPGDISWEGEISFLESKKWKEYYGVINRKAKSFVVWTSQKEYLKSLKNDNNVKPIYEIVITKNTSFKDYYPPDSDDCNIYNDYYKMCYKIKHNKKKYIAEAKTRDWIHSFYEILGSLLNEEANPYSATQWPHTY